ncbi:response regulator [Flavivirga eckloniae]|nr:response regulator [Flavivirga eckloniae]
MAQEVIKIEPDDIYTMQPERFPNPTVRDSLTIDQAIHLSYTDTFIDRPAIGKDHWARFQFEVDTIHNIKRINFTFSQSDKLVLFVPKKQGGFQRYEAGLLIFDEPIIEFHHASRIVINTAQVDFTRPFYFKNIPLTFFGNKAVNTDVSFETYSYIPVFNKDTYKDSIRSYETFEFTFAMLIGMIIIAFVFMILHFAIIRKIYFLYFSLYMFCLIFNYGYRTFYFYNLYAGIKPILYFYFNQNGQLLAHLFYMFFFVSFVDMKNNYKKLYKVVNGTIYFFLGFIVAYNALILINPYTSYHLLLVNSVIHIISFLNLLYVIYAFIKKGTLETKIMAIGSACVVIGYIIAFNIGFFILVPIIVLEAAVFMSVLSYLDLKKYKVILESKKKKEMDILKSDFYANISHEFRTPLTLIAVPIEEKLSDKKLSEKDRTNFEMIQRNNKRLLGLVDQLLEMSKAESGYQKLQINKGNILGVISAIADSFVYKAKQKGVTYIISVEKNRENRWYDRDIIEKVTINLLSNAIKYTSEGGGIVCRAFIKEGILYLKVKNTGKGLSKEQSEKIFERFYQVDNYQPGSGIGLALVKELVKLHKGTIQVESKPNEWIAFKVGLSVHKNDFKNSDIRIETSEKTFAPELLTPCFTNGVLVKEETSKKRNNELPVILIVEDNEDLRMLLKETFEKAYKVIVAKNGRLGIDLALNHIPDLIISDIMMPVKDGVELTRELKNDECTCHIPIILLTAKVGEDNELVGIVNGADDYIVKPFNMKVLISKVKNIIKLRQKLQDRYRRESEINPKMIATNSIDEKFWGRVNDILLIKLMDSSFTADEFSKSMGMARMTLHRKLRSLTGLSTTEFVNVERLKKAAQCLRSSDLTVSEIATDVGFDTISYFNKCFKDIYRCTPTEYRRR